MMLKRIGQKIAEQTGFTKAGKRRFWADERGTIKILTVLLAAPLVMTVAAAVDTAELYRARVNFQNAVDAATLSAAKTITYGGSVNEAETQGKRVFQANIGNIAPATGDIDFIIKKGECATTGVVGNAYIDHELFFEFWHEENVVSPKPGHARLNASATVKCGNQTVEIAMVLDNSGSMRDNSKLDTLKSASSLLVNTLHDTISKSGGPKPIQFSLVPFAGFVNVGSEHANRDWMDKDGRSSIHHEHLDWASNADATKDGKGWKGSSGKWLTRMDIYNRVSGIKWRGCVEQRPWPYHTQDTTPNSSDYDTYFVHSFSPDRPDNWSSQSNVYRYNGSGSWSYVGRKYEYSYYNDWLDDGHNHPFDSSNGIYVYEDGHMGAGKDKQHTRQNWTWKYFNGATARGDSEYYGPNEDCNTTALTDLTHNENQILKAIKDMVAEGSTNIQHGVAWGWRTLSPSDPFTNGRDYSVDDNKKIMIVMTDGNNTYYPTPYNGDRYNVSRYGAHGMSDNDRIFKGYTTASIAHTSENFTKAMDSHLSKTCENVKATGIQIYTIAFDVADGSSVKATLENCASSGPGGAKLYYDASDNASLEQAFKDIGDKITELAITK